MYKLEFANAHILGLTEEFDAYSGTPLHFNLKIGWGIVRINGVIFEEAWNPHNPWEETEATVIEEEGEPTFLGYRFEDEEGSEINQSDIEPEQEVTLVIETENADGDTINLNLSNNRLDYKYDGKTAENDVIEGIYVTGDETRIQLTILEQQS